MCQDVGRVDSVGSFKTVSAFCSHLWIDLDCGDVCLPVYVSHHGLVRISVVELNTQLWPPRHHGSRSYHMSIGHNHARVGHNEPRTTGEVHVATQERMSGKRKNN